MMTADEYKKWLKLLDIPTQFETERLIIRLLEEEDAKELHERVTESRDFILEFTNWCGTGYETVEDVIAKIRHSQAEFYNRNYLRFFMFEKSTGKLAGLIAQHCANHHVPTWELSCSLFVGYTKRGYATEATKAMIEMGFELFQANKILIGTDTDNEHSQRVIEKLGFTFEATLRQQMWNWNQTKIFDFVNYGLLRPEYEADKSFYQVLQ